MGISWSNNKGIYFGPVLGVLHDFGLVDRSTGLVGPTSPNEQTADRNHKINPFTVKEQAKDISSAQVTSRKAYKVIKRHFDVSCIIFNFRTKVRYCCIIF